MQEYYSVKVQKKDGSTGWLTCLKLFGERIVGPQMNRARFVRREDAIAAAGEMVELFPKVDIVPFWDIDSDPRTSAY